MSRYCCNVHTRQFAFLLMYRAPRDMSDAFVYSHFNVSLRIGDLDKQQVPHCALVISHYIRRPGHSNRVLSAKNSPLYFLPFLCPSFYRRPLFLSLFLRPSYGLATHPVCIRSTSASDYRPIIPFIHVAVLYMPGKTLGLLAAAAH